MTEAFTAGFGMEAPCAGKQRLCPSASGSLQPARNTWRVTPPGRALHGKWPLEKSRLVHRSCAFFSANKLRSGVSSQSPCLFREKGCSQRDSCPPTHRPLYCLVLSHQPVECREFHGVQEIELGKVGRGKTQAGRHTQSRHLTTLGHLEQDRSLMGALGGLL